MMVTSPRGTTWLFRRDSGARSPGPRVVRHCHTVACTLLTGWTLLVNLHPAVAEPATQPGFDPRQTERRFDAQQSERQQSARPRVRLPQFSEPASPVADTRPQFKLRSVTIAGATAISPEALQATYQNCLGKPVSVADLTAITTAISDLYRAAGFHLSRAVIAPQDIADGRVRITVIEGSISEVALHGDDDGRFGIRPMLAPILAEHPSRLGTMERQLLLINARAGVRIADTSIEEIGKLTGRFRLVVDLKAWNVYTSFGFDNLGSSSVGPWQTYATAAFNSYLLPGDSLAVNLSTTPGDPRELKFGRLSYDVPLGIDGFKIGASALYSDVRPGDFRRLFEDRTTTESFELRGSMTPLQTQRASVTLTAAFDYINSREANIFGEVYEDHVRTASLTADGRLQDNFGGINYLTLTYRQGLNIFDATQLYDDWSSRWFASPNSAVLDYWFTRYQTITDAWSLKVAATGQLASGPLLLSQQFYLGGAAFGRGYGSAEISGDNGIAGSLELRFDQKLGWRYLTGYQLYSFVDAGAAWNDGFSYNDGLALTSVGGGVRLFMWDDFKADVGVAFPLSYRAPDNSARTARVMFSLSTALKMCPGQAQGCL
jgi:hemolysin activation/secretion protein